MSIVIWPPPPTWGESGSAVPDMPDGWVDAVREAAAGEAVLTPASEREALAAAETARAWIGRLTPALFAASRHLRWLQVPSTSLEAVVFPELAASDVVLTNMRDIHGDHVSNHALTMFLSLCRKFPRFFRQQLASEWRSDVHFLDPGAMTVAIVGIGSIGAALAVRLAPLGSTIVGVDPKIEIPPPGVARIVSPEGLADLLGRVDAVIVCAPLTPVNKGLFDEAMFRRMRPGSIFINVGRGPIVKLAALERALTEGWIGMAGMDVFETEPLPAGSPLWTMENVIITPHAAGMAEGADRRFAIMIENVRRFVSGETLANVADKNLWY